MDFVALDFETANHSADSPCQLAVVVVEQSKIVHEQSWLIRPKRLYFSARCVAVHGILPEHVRDQPEWDRVGPEMLKLLEGRIAVAHNAGFDLRVLNATNATYDLAPPEIEFSCSRLISRRTWPGRSGYGLKPTADALGLSFRHHDALEDARVCAMIVLASAEKLGATSFEDLELKLAILRGRLRYGSLVGPRCIRKNRIQRDESLESIPTRSYRRDGFPERVQKARQRWHSVDALLNEVETTAPLKNRSVVLNGTLLGLQREEAVQFLERLGAKVQSKINLETDYLIAGNAPLVPAPGVAIGSEEGLFPIAERTQAVEHRQRQGQPIRILTQRQLLALIPGGLDMARALAERSS